MQAFESVLGALVDVLWGWPLVIGLISVGIYLAFRSGFWHIRHFGHAVGYCLSKLKRGKGDYENSPGKLTQFEAFSVALSGAIGVGNIGGVASAISIGGPGALFWMWVVAVIGMMTKMVEVTLALYYRDRRPDGSTWGGPTFYMEKGIGKDLGLGKLWFPMACVFGLGIFSTLFIELETYTISEAMAATFHLPQIPVAAVYCLLVYAVIWGGLTRLGKFASRVVPFMALFYILSGLYILAGHFTHLPEVFATIVRDAFNPTAAFGGFAGSAVIITIRTGVSRSLWSNEAGWGTAPMAHATAQVDHPVKQGMWGVFEVFVDTILVCSITGLVIVATGAWGSGLSGAALTLKAFESEIGWFGTAIITVSVFLFAWTSSTGWYSYYTSIVEHVFRNRPATARKIVVLVKYGYSVPAFILVVFAVQLGMKTDLLWLLADLTTAVPTYANILALFLLGGKFKQILDDYNRRTFGVMNPQYRNSPFYDDNPIGQKVGEKMPQKQTI